MSLPTSLTAALVWTGAALCLGVMGARADLIDETAVYIKCQTGEERARVGSGVIISPDGMVLTAKHVVFGNEGTPTDRPSCQGAIGNKNFPLSGLLLKKISKDYDAALLKFPRLSDGPFLKFCRLTPDLKRKTIAATGFPGKTLTGVSSTRAGVLSSIDADINGIIEADVAVASGMSGSVVTLPSGQAFVGIVNGVDIDPATGLVAFTRILSAQVLESEFAGFGLAEDKAGCFPKDQLTPVLGTVDGRPWRVQDGPLDIERPATEYFCALGSVWGHFDHEGDRVELVVDNGRYLLQGANHGGADSIGAMAQCRRF